MEIDVDSTENTGFTQEWPAAPALHHSQLCTNHHNAQMRLFGFALKRKRCWVHRRRQSCDPAGDSPAITLCPWGRPQHFQIWTCSKNGMIFLTLENAGSYKGSWNKTRWNCPQVSWRFGEFPPVSHLHQQQISKPPLQAEEQPGMKWEHFLWKQAPAGSRARTRATVFRAIIKRVNSKVCCWNCPWRRSCSGELRLEPWLFCICEWGWYMVSFNRWLCSDELSERERTWSVVAKCGLLTP